MSSPHLRCQLLRYSHDMFKQILNMCRLNKGLSRTQLKAGQRLDHPHIVKLFEHFED